MAIPNLDLGVTGTTESAVPCTIFELHIANNSAGTRFVKLYNKASAATASDSPQYIIVLPPLTPISRTFPLGLSFSVGLSLRATTGLANADTGAPTTGDVIVGILDIRKNG